MGVRWTTEKELKFLQGKVDEFQDAREAGTVDNFYVAVSNEFLAKFPVVLKPSEIDGKADKEVNSLKTVKIEALKKRICKWFQNNGYSTKRKLKRAGTGTAASSVITKVAVASGLAGRNTRQLQDTEIYQRLFREDVKATVDDVMAAEEESDFIGNASPEAGTEGTAQTRAQRRLVVLRQVLRNKMDTATPEQKEQIKEFRENDIAEKKRKIEALKGDGDSPVDVDTHQAIDALPGFLAEVFNVTKRATDYSFFVVGGGKDPLNPHLTRTLSWYVGRDLNGLSFSKLYANEINQFSVPWATYIQRAYGDRAPDGSSQSPSSSTNPADGPSQSASASTSPSTPVMDEILMSSSTSKESSEPLSFSSNTPVTEREVPSFIVSPPTQMDETSAHIPVTSSSTSPHASPSQTNESMAPVSTARSSPANDFLVSSSHSAQPQLPFMTSSRPPEQTSGLSWTTPTTNTMFPTSDVRGALDFMQQPSPSSLQLWGMDGGLVSMPVSSTSFNGSWSNELGNSNLRADLNMFGEGTTFASTWTSGTQSRWNHNTWSAGDLSNDLSLTSSTFPDATVPSLPNNATSDSSSTSDFLFPTPSYSAFPAATVPSPPNNASSDSSSTSDFLFPTPSNDSGIFPSTISSQCLGGTQHSVPSKQVPQKNSNTKAKAKKHGKESKGPVPTHTSDPTAAILQPTQSPPKRPTLKRKELDGLSPSAVVDGKRARRGTVPGRVPQNIVVGDKPRSKTKAKPRKKVKKSLETVSDNGLEPVDEAEKEAEVDTA